MFMLFDSTREFVYGLFMYLIYVVMKFMWECMYIYKCYYLSSKFLMISIASAFTKTLALRVTSFALIPKK